MRIHQPADVQALPCTQQSDARCITCRLVFAQAPHLLVQCRLLLVSWGEYLVFLQPSGSPLIQASKLRSLHHAYGGTMQARGHSHRSRIGMRVMRPSDDTDMRSQPEKVPFGSLNRSSGRGAWLLAWPLGEALAPGDAEWPHNSRTVGDTAPCD